MNPFATQSYQKRDRIFIEMFQRRKKKQTKKTSPGTVSIARIQKQRFFSLHLS